MVKYFQLLRVHHWLKNGFIFAPAFFGGVLISGNIWPLIYTFFAFSLVASAVYIFNDACDVANDRLHPEKKKRPIASGEVPLNTAWLLAVIFAVAGLALAYMVHLHVCMVVGAYLGVNILYSLGLKRIALLDILIVSSGFILRVVAGGIVAGIVISHWLYLMTFLLAIFLAIAKRRDDLVILQETGVEMRKAIKGYTLEYVNVVMAIMCAVIIVSYILYITSPEIATRFGDKPLYVSTVFVIIGLLRYLQITIVEKKSGSPTRVLLSDIFTQAFIVMWIAFFGIIIYAT